MEYSLLFIGACHAVFYLLLRPVQFAICCRTLDSLSMVAIPTAQHNLGEIGHSKNCLTTSSTKEP